MQIEELRNRESKVIGRIRHTPTGTRLAEDPHGRFLGSYHPQTNQTRDPANHLVGYGNLLPALISAAL